MAVASKGRAAGGAVVSEQQPRKCKRLASSGTARDHIASQLQYAMPTRPLARDRAALDPAALAERLHQAGLRSTRAVLAVAALFDAAGPGWGPTHAEVAARLAERGAPLNPVTLYRLLERLVAAGLLARATPPGERSWRFRWLGTDAAAARAPAAAVPLFECDACHALIPLQGADAPAQAVADALRRTLAGLGHQAARVDLAVHGTCAGCRRGARPAHS